MTTASNPRPRVKPERHVSFEPFVNGVAFIGMTAIEARVRTAPKQTHFGYFLHKIDADFGLGFRVKKAGSVPDGEPSSYDVNIDLQRGHHSCDCKGNTYCGHCKHVESILALIKAGKIDVPQPERQPVPEVCAFDDP